TTEIYTLSLHDALPIWSKWWGNTDAARMRDTRYILREPCRSSAITYHVAPFRIRPNGRITLARPSGDLSYSIRTSWASHTARARSEEHTSELQSLAYLV